MTINGYESLVNQLQEQLVKAQMDRGALLYCVKQAYLDQAHPRSILAVSLLEEIHRHDPTWAPPKVEAGSYQSNGTKAKPAPWVPLPCKRCGKPRNAAQVFCGAACGARWEAGDR